MSYTLKYFLLSSVILLTAGRSHAQEMNIIPQPVICNLKSGNFNLNKEVGIQISHKEIKPVADFLLEYIQKITGAKLSYTSKANKSIVLTIDSGIKLPEEGYLLDISSTKIIAKAKNTKGLIYAVQSIIQLMPSIRTNQLIQLPNLQIEDYPQFGWRGMHLDVSRHFFSIDFVKEYIDLMAQYKLNTFHWHLVDDQGWRIEIKKYPALTKIGAWRADYTNILWGDRPLAKTSDTPEYGGYYTQSQIKELIAYAGQRNITIVPEIEMPGHVASAIASIPNLSCDAHLQLPLTGGNYNGASSNYCIGKEQTFSFIEDVLDEVIGIFPSAYIHVGGDEVDKTQWKNCQLCQQRMKEEGLKNEEELQSYFMKRIEGMLAKKKRKMIGWDEILEGGLAPNAAVMSWRGEAGGIQAAKLKHTVVMTPGSPLYFDHYQAGPEGEPNAIGGFNSLKKVYEYNPIPTELSTDESKYIIGAQANLWTEFITTNSAAEYMILPRMLALSESLWSPTAQKNFDKFNTKLQKHFKTFDQRGLNYCKGNYTVAIRPNNTNGPLSVSLSTEVPNTTIRFTTDGSMPDISSSVYTQPILINATQTIKAICLLGDKVMNLMPSEQKFVYHKAISCPVVYKKPPYSGYMANGLHSLTDGIRGKNPVTQFWHGFYQTNLEAVIDLGAEKDIQQISLGCLQAYKDWIFLPSKVEFAISENGIDYTTTGMVINDISPSTTSSTIKDFTLKLSSKIKARYVKVTAYPLAACPVGHPGEGKPTWIFADELMVE